MANVTGLSSKPMQRTQPFVPPTLMKLTYPLSKSCLILFATLLALCAMYPLHAQIFVDTTGTAFTGSSYAISQSTDAPPLPYATAVSPPASSTWPSYFGGPYLYTGSDSAPSSTGISTSVATTSNNYNLNYIPSTSLLVNVQLQAKMGFSSTGASQDFGAFNQSSSLDFTLLGSASVNLNGLENVVVDTASATFGGDVTLVDDTLGTTVLSFNLAALPTPIAYSGILGPDSYTLYVDNYAKAAPLLGPLILEPPSEEYGSSITLKLDIESVPEPSQAALMILGSSLLLFWRVRSRRLK